MHQIWRATADISALLAHRSLTVTAWISANKPVIDRAPHISADSATAAYAALEPISARLSYFSPPVPLPLGHTSQLRPPRDIVCLPFATKLPDQIDDSLGAIAHDAPALLELGAALVALVKRKAQDAPALVTGVRPIDGEAAAVERRDADTHAQQARGPDAADVEVT